MLTIEQRGGNSFFTELAEQDKKTNGHHAEGLTKKRRVEMAYPGLPGRLAFEPMNRPIRGTEVIVNADGIESTRTTDAEGKDIVIGYETVYVLSGICIDETKKVPVIDETVSVDLASRTKRVIRIQRAETKTISHFHPLQDCLYLGENFCLSGVDYQGPAWFYTFQTLKEESSPSQISGRTKAGIFFSHDNKGSPVLLAKNAIVYFRGSAFVQNMKGPDQEPWPNPLFFN